MKYSDCKSKKAKVEFLREKLNRDLQWATRGLLKIYSFQTASEQAVQATQVWNNVGFTGADGTILSSFAEQVQAGRTLSVKQKDILLARMPKYAKQLQKIADGDQT